MTSAKENRRREMRSLLALLSPKEIERDSRQLRALLQFPAGSRVALFAATPREPMLLELIPARPDIQWFLPRVTGPASMDFLRVTDLADLKPGTYGILEPSSGEKAPALDAIVCPGLAFTPGGHRLGQGGGFYDRALTRHPAARKLGVAFACQISENLPHEPHDHPMDQVLSPTPEQPTEIPES